MTFSGRGCILTAMKNACAGGADMQRIFAIQAGDANILCTASRPGQ
jgi:hypothetical protein